MLLARQQKQRARVWGRKRVHGSDKPPCAVTTAEREAPGGTTSVSSVSLDVRGLRGCCSPSFLNGEAVNRWKTCRRLFERGHPPTCLCIDALCWPEVIANSSNHKRMSLPRFSRGCRVVGFCVPCCGRSVGRVGVSVGLACTLRGQALSSFS